MATRIKDIARLAEVSPAAVSLVLNGKPGVGEETRAKILRIAEDLDYRGPKKEDRPSSGDSTICFLHIARNGHIVNRDHDVFIADYMQGLSRGSKSEGLNLQILTFKTTPLEKIVATAKDLAAAGLIVLGTELLAPDIEAFQAVGKPVVFIDNYHDFLPFDFVDMNNADSVDTIVDHFVRMGHTRLGIVSSSMETRNFKLREEEFRSSLERRRLTYQKDWCFSVDSTFHGAYEDMKSILKGAPELPSALFCANDLIACACLRAFREAGIRVPEDLSIAGFDDLPISSVAEPPLTTIQVSKAHIGRMAVQILISRIRGEADTPPVKILVSGRLVERESVRRLS